MFGEKMVKTKRNTSKNSLKCALKNFGELLAVPEQLFGEYSNNAVI